jgi:hypothetical protein
MKSGGIPGSSEEKEKKELESVPDLFPLDVAPGCAGSVPNLVEIERLRLGEGWFRQLWM